MIGLDTSEVHNNDYDWLRYIRST